MLWDLTALEFYKCKLLPDAPLHFFVPFDAVVSDEHAILIVVRY